MSDVTKMTDKQFIQYLRDYLAGGKPGSHPVVPLEKTNGVIDREKTLQMDVYSGLRGGQ